MNNRLTAKDRALLKGALRRAFARSELRKSVIEAAAIKHSDPKRPRVKKWVTCAVCKKPSPKWSSAVDHLVPVVALDSSFEEQGMDVTVDRTWCQVSNLQVICEGCHDIKTASEKEVRKQNKKLKGKK